MSGIYCPLAVERREFRVLEVQPGTFDAGIHCRLLPTSLLDPDRIAYEALSYVWGEPHFTERLTLNGHPVFVTKNLAAALRHLRPEVGEKPRTIWVDALCINQQDLAERNQQVTMMKEIYSNCTVDLAWLGPDSSSRKDLAQQEKELSQGCALFKKIAMKDEVTLASLQADYQKDREWLSKLKKEGRYLAYDNQRLLDAVFKTAPLWSRLWVIQELSLAPRVILVAGNDTLDWDLVASFLGDAPYLDAFHLQWSHGMLRPAVNYTFEEVQTIHQQRETVRACAEGTCESMLMDVLARFKSADSLDPRDKIYGLLGLVSQEHDIKIAYDRPWQLVWADVARYFIDLSANLDVVCQNPWTITSPAMDKTTNTQLPSWVPNFASKNYSGLSDHFSALLFAQRGIFAAGNLACTVPCQTSEDGGALHATAILIGAFGQVPLDHTICTEARRQHISWYSAKYALTAQELINWHFGDYNPSPIHDKTLMYEPTAEPAFQAFWRTLVMDCKCYPIERLASDQVTADDKAYRKMLLEYSPDEIKTIFNYDKDDTDEGNPQKRAELQDLQESLVSWTMWERNHAHWTFTVSQNGLYCMVKGGVRPDDVLAVLDGGKVPVVLRAVDGDASRFTFVTTAYVHGFMDGQASRAMDAGRLTKQEIMLV